MFCDVCDVCDVCEMFDTNNINQQQDTARYVNISVNVCEQ